MTKHDIELPPLNLEKNMTQPYEVIDWNEISRRGLLERINREIMHPLGLAVFRVVETGASGGALVSPDGEWCYPDDAEPMKVAERCRAAQDPLQGAANWFVETITDCRVADIQCHLIIGYNRAKRLFDAAMEQQK